jgi:regulator of protease activity HflC (stomatin/prohibitin superfamily)
MTMESWASDLLWVAGMILFVIVFWSLVGYPKWRVWAAHQEGLADLQRARNEQQIQIAAAQSRLDAAQLNKQAAIIEAEAVAEQVSKIGTQLTHHDLYLRWQWIRMMEQAHNNNDSTIIYVPTEANLPVLEAGRLNADQ